jgi:chromosome segregation ATPase
MRGEFGEIEDKVENEMSVKVNMMINEVDRLGATLDLRNDEISKWKKKFDELEVGNSRQVQDLEGAVYRLKSELSRLESALKQRESRLNELENIVRTQDVRIKECQDENWYLKKDNEAYANKVSVLEPELENSKSQKKRLDVELGEMKKDIHSIAKRVEESENDNEFLRAENSGLKNSNK